MRKTKGKNDGDERSSFPPFAFVTFLFIPLRFCSLLLGFFPPFPAFFFFFPPFPSLFPSFPVSFPCFLFPFFPPFWTGKTTMGLTEKRQKTRYKPEKRGARIYFLLLLFFFFFFFFFFFSPWIPPVLFCPPLVL